MADRDKGPSGPAGSDFVRKLVTDPKNPPKVVQLFGYAGTAAEDGHTRLYLNPSLTDHVEIPTDKILHTVDVPASVSPLGGSYVWVDPEAKLIPAQGPTTKIDAGQFLSGAVYADYLRPVVGLHPTQVCTYGCPPTFSLDCATHSCPPPTYQPHCPQEYLAAMPQTAATVCTQLGCPRTSTCPPTTAPGCPGTSTCPPTGGYGCPSTSTCPPQAMVGLQQTSATVCTQVECPPTHMLGCPGTSTCPPTHMLGCPGTSTCPPTHMPGCPGTSTCPPTHMLGCPGTSTCPPALLAVHPPHSIATVCTHLGCPRTSTCPPTTAPGCPGTSTCPPTGGYGCPSTSTCPPHAMAGLMPTAATVCTQVSCPTHAYGCPSTSTCPPHATMATVCTQVACPTHAYGCPGTSTCPPNFMTMLPPCPGPVLTMVCPTIACVPPTLACGAGGGGYSY